LKKPAGTSAMKGVPRKSAAPSAKQSAVDVLSGLAGMPQCIGAKAASLIKQALKSIPSSGKPKPSVAGPSEQIAATDVAGPWMSPVGKRGKLPVFVAGDLVEIQTSDGDSSGRCSVVLEVVRAQDDADGVMVEPCLLGTDEMGMQQWLLGLLDSGVSPLVHPSFLAERPKKLVA